MIKELEIIRGFAAYYVFQGHLLQMLGLNKNRFVDLVFCYFGQEMVMLFFILSGFVIALSWNKKPISTSLYLKKRFFRIYPLFLTSLLLGLFYALISNNDVKPFELLGNILNLQDFKAGKPNVLFDTYYNSALWSLSYEWWFYLIFILLIKSNNPNRWAFVIIFANCILYLFYPNQISRWLMYFGIWWSGTILFHLFDKLDSLNFKHVIKLTPFILPPLLVVLFNVFKNPITQLGTFPFLEFRHITFSILIIVLVVSCFKKFKFIKHLTIFSKIAPFSYGLYITHIPISKITLFLLNFRFNKSFLFFMCFTMSLTFAYIFEKKIQSHLIKYLKRIKIL